MEGISLRRANKEDSSLILDFIKKIATYEKMLDTVKTTVSDIEFAIFERKIGNVIFLIKDNKEIGFALYFYNFSTFTGKCGIHLEDFYVDEEYRHQGLGTILFKEVVKVAKEENCPRLEWTCLNWNEPSIRFYKSIGAKPLDEWITFRLVYEDYDFALNK